MNDLYVSLRISTQRVLLSGVLCVSAPGGLSNDRSIFVTGGADMDGKLTFAHTDYERFLDLRRLRHGTKTSKSNKKINNRYVFGAYSSIASRLMYDLADDVSESIRKQMEGGV